MDISALGLDTREGLRDYLERRPQPFEVLNASQINRLTPSQRRTYDETRIARLSSDHFLQLPQFSRVLNEVAKIDRYNRPLTRQSSGNLRACGRRGVMISGDSGTGKTTSCMASLSERWWFYRKRGLGQSLDEAPIVYLGVPPAATAKSMAGALAEYLAVPHRPRDTLAEILDRVTMTLSTLGTRIVAIDELHNLAVRTSTTGESAQVLKALYNRVNATFIYAGMSIDKQALVEGPIGSQIRARFVPVVLHPYAYGTTETDGGRQDQAIWRGILNSFIPELMLGNQSAGKLCKLSRYLHLRTSGSIGALGYLLTTAAQELIGQHLPAEKEYLTVSELDNITLDLHSEEISDWYRSNVQHKRRSHAA